MRRAIHTTAPLALIGVVVLFLSAAQVRLISNNFDTQLDEHIKAAEGVVEGRPHWRLYQSRVLGPYMVFAMETVTGWTPHEAYTAVMFIWLAVFFGILVAVSKQVWHSRLRAIAVASSAALLNAMLMQGKWLYPWDFIDLIIFTLVTWAIVLEKPLYIIAGIIVIEMFNREAATIIAAWWAIDALFAIFARRWRGETATDHSARLQLVVAVSLVAVSLLTTEGLRSMLLVREIGPDVFPPGTSGPTSYAALQIGWNLHWLRATITSMPTSLFIYHSIILAIPVLSVLGVISGVTALSRISVLTFILWSVTLLFGLINETRVWLSFVPYLVLVGPKILRAYSPPALPSST